MKPRTPSQGSQRRTSTPRKSPDESELSAAARSPLRLSGEPQKSSAGAHVSQFPPPQRSDSALEMHALDMSHVSQVDSPTVPPQPPGSPCAPLAAMGSSPEDSPRALETARASRVDAAPPPPPLAPQAPRGAGWWVGMFALAFCLAAVLLPFVGPFGLSLARLRARQEPDWSIFVQLRISRTLLGLFAGGALSLAGTLFQAMLRDALATPYTLGISAGASLGAVLAIWGGWQQIAGVPAIWAASLAGAFGVLALVVAAAVRRRQVSSFGLLLSGLAANSVCSAGIIVILGRVGAAQSMSIARWLIGSLDAVDYPALGALIAVVTLAAVVVVRQARAWNLMAVDPAWAATRGADVSRLTLMAYAAGSVLTAVTVALTGPIGFIGLVVPHLVRRRVAADHRVLMPCAFLGGGILLAACDALGRIIAAPSEVPAGAVMAVIGGPYLVWLLHQREPV